MRYRLHKLVFSAPVHFGGESGSAGLVAAQRALRSDSLFSALCIEAAGAGMLDDLVECARSGALRLSDLLPYTAAEYYLPKPCLPAQENARAAWAKQEGNRKWFKKLDYIPVRSFSEYTAAVNEDGAAFDPRPALGDLAGLGESAVRTRVALTGAESRPYHVGAFTFAPDCGLYLITGTTDEAAARLVEDLLGALAAAGIGGKRSSGFGRFSVSPGEDLVAGTHDAHRQLTAMLTASGPGMILNTALPGDEELEAAMDGAAYTLIRRGGFVQSPAYAPGQVKKRELYAFAAGSFFTRRFEGELRDLAGDGGAHAVYRLLTPMFAGVEL